MQRTILQNVPFEIDIPQIEYYMFVVHSSKTGKYENPSLKEFCYYYYYLCFKSFTSHQVASE